MGLKRALSEVLAGVSWQRCRVHFMRGLLSRVPKHAQAEVMAWVRTTFAQPDQGNGQKAAGAGGGAPGMEVP